MKKISFAAIILLSFILIQPAVSLDDHEAEGLPANFQQNISAKSLLPRFLPTEVKILDLPNMGKVSIVNFASINQQASAASVSTGKNKLNLGNLFVLDNLFSGESSGLLESKRTSIGDLLVLNNLFNKSKLGSSENEYSLGDLFVLDKLFDREDGVQLNPDETSLGDLFILDRLFNN